MPTVKDIFDYLNAFAPVSMKMDFDNVGFLAGFSDTVVTKVCLALDITSEVIDEAVENGAQLIVSHHPMFFSLKNVTDLDLNGAKVAKLLKNGLSAICMHTNLDAAKHGVNQALAEKLGINDPEILVSEGVCDGYEYSCSRCGYIDEPMSMADFLPFVKTALNSKGLRYYDSGRPVEKLAVVGGSGGSYLTAAHDKGCDTIVTADVKYDVFLDAKALGMNIIDGDHFCTENVVIPVLAEKIKEGFNNIEVIISSKHGQTANFF